jgi:hypothetical protein
MCRELVTSYLRYRLAAAPGLAEHAVVVEDDHAVGVDLGIGFQRAGTEPERRREGLELVVGTVAGPAAVSEPDPVGAGHVGSR